MASEGSYDRGRALTHLPVTDSTFTSESRFILALSIRLRLPSCHHMVATEADGVPAYRGPLPLTCSSDARPLPLVPRNGVKYRSAFARAAQKSKARPHTKANLWVPLISTEAPHRLLISFEMRIGIRSRFPASSIVPPVSS